MLDQELRLWRKGRGAILVVVIGGRLCVFGEVLVERQSCEGR